MKHHRKPWYCSKTIWFNVFACLVSIIIDLNSALHTGGMLTTTSIINIVLRVISRRALTWR